MTAVPFFDYSRHYLDDRDNYLKIIDEVSSKGAFIMQNELSQFEENLSSFTKAKYSIGVANATDGLEMCWMAIGLNPTDEVIISSHTMLATASAIKLAGGKPIPVDIGYDNLIDPLKVEEAINENTVGIMPTQLNGRTCDMDKIMSIANKYNLYVVEDAAQALGSSFNGKFAGTFGHASSISFYPAKVLGCLGDGGAILTNSENLFQTIYQLHDHGRDLNGIVRRWGRNSRLDNLNAAILDFKLKSYKDVIKRRRQIASIYQERLSTLEYINLPPAPGSEDKHFDIFQNYEITARNRNQLKKYLHDLDIGTLIQWGGQGIHQFKELGFDLNLPNTELFFKKCLMLPINLFISDNDVNYVCDSIIKFYK
ncbi:DegT/DnrJ/EryC1/StrS family aminotransferase [Prochlorococcus marinus]|uniref:DegT/DnrJ/EryC1/StrS family aminotransferase n=1 Tax=Prochlorococcus marinus XMU1408 TaxID=2213228 RepID=A0A318R099_PROMR|nr:DegT/DnrJ/EryC1/StrS family aminotransferase [Prochlorococcus marinus]MBW3041839.1 DegT/DnrJ/EryC1/StrS family aminotransferase [Prochlorococcus marinus str. XMU1408]PYE02977.1 DegT/DnrJ/EryC1/StrS family aminotransferase [Prochlorococcus marinus XMU1408]